MMEHEIRPGKGVRRTRKRIGRGNSAGQGTYAGRGLKGQKSRSGKPPRPVFEGGQLPLIKRLPEKRGFTNIFKTRYHLIKLTSLEIFDAGQQVGPVEMLDKGLLPNLKYPVKILGGDEISKAITVSATKFTTSAREAIEKAGGTTEVIGS